MRMPAYPSWTICLYLIFTMIIGLLYHKVKLEIVGLPKFCLWCMATQTEIKKSGTISAALELDLFPITLSHGSYPYTPLRYSGLHFLPSYCFQNIFLQRPHLHISFFLCSFLNLSFLQELLVYHLSL